MGAALTLNPTKCILPPWNLWGPYKKSGLAVQGILVHGPLGTRYAACQRHDSRLLKSGANFRLDAQYTLHLKLLGFRVQGLYRVEGLGFLLRFRAVGCFRVGEAFCTPPAVEEKRRFHLQSGSFSAFRV